MSSLYSSHSDTAPTPQYTYEDWSKAVSEFFFRTRHGQRPVYLQVDRDTISEIGASIGVTQEQAEVEFVRTVRGRLCGSSYDTNPFKNFIRLTKKWEISTLPNDSSAAPPFMGLLGLCVLAASQMSMDPDKGVSSSNYYVRLNGLLGLGSD